MGTGLKPNRIPSEWEKRPLPMTAEAPQGPLKQGVPTSRSQAPLPSEVISVLEQGGGFTAQILAGRPGMQREKDASAPGDDSNKSGPTGFPAAGLGNGSGLISKPGIMGSAIGGAAGHGARPGTF